MTRRRSCLLRRHDWRTEYDEETKRTSWECRRCGSNKATPKPGWPMDMGLIGAAFDLVAPRASERGRTAP